MPTARHQIVDCEARQEKRLLRNPAPKQQVSGNPRVRPPTHLDGHARGARRAATFRSPSAPNSSAPKLPELNCSPSPVGGVTAMNRRPLPAVALQTIQAERHRRSRHACPDAAFREGKLKLKFAHCPVLSRRGKGEVVSRGGACRGHGGPWRVATALRASYFKLE